MNVLYYENIFATNLESLNKEVTETLRKNTNNFLKGGVVHVANVSADSIALSHDQKSLWKASGIHNVSGFIQTVVVFRDR